MNGSHNGLSTITEFFETEYTDIIVLAYPQSIHKFTVTQGIQEKWWGIQRERASTVGVVQPEHGPYPEVVRTVSSGSFQGSWVTSLQRVVVGTSRRPPLVFLKIGETIHCQRVQITESVTTV